MIFDQIVSAKQEQFSEIPGDQPELSKWMMPLLIKYQDKLIGDGLELKRIDECLLI